MSEEPLRRGTKRYTVDGDSLLAPNDSRVGTLSPLNKGSRYLGSRLSFGRV